jgi:peptide/nickel transport system substrate-binding protein
VRWTMTLRPNVKFSDGAPFNAAAVQFSWTRLTDPQLGSDARQVAQQITDITTPDDLTVNFALQQKNAQFPQLVNSLGGLNWIVSPTAVNQQGQNFANAPVGAGPFVVKEWIRNSKIELTRNANYYQKGLPRLDALTVEINTNLQTHYDAVATGQAQGFVTSVQTNNAQARADGLKVVSYELDGGINMTFNTNKAPFSDPRARHAVVNAFDPGYFNQTVTAGQEIVADTIFNPKSPYFDESAVQRHDMAQAQKLLDELAAEGKPLAFEFLSNPTTLSKGAAQALTAVFGQLRNVTVNVKSVDLPTYGGMLQRREFDAALGGSMGTDPDLAFYNAFHPQGAVNFSGWNNPIAAKALQDGRDASDPAARRAAYLTFQKELIKDAPVEFLIRSSAVMITRANVAGIQLYAAGSPILTNAYFES